MFEKESVEYLKKEGAKSAQIFSTMLEEAPLQITSKQIPYIFATVAQAFQDGAEYGYNKANEWHKQDYSLFDFVMKYENGKFKCEYKSGKLFESVDGETWKEIVLPKEIKEK